MGYWGHSMIPFPSISQAAGMLEEAIEFIVSSKRRDKADYWSSCVPRCGRRSLLVPVDRIFPARVCTCPCVRQAHPCSYRALGLGATVPQTELRNGVGGNASACGHVPLRHDIGWHVPLRHDIGWHVPLRHDIGRHVPLRHGA
jgi:hypothetical protein